MTTELPANISAARDVSAVTVAATSPSSANTTLSDEPRMDRLVVRGSNIALMLREESPSVAFDAEFHLFFIVDDGDIYLSRFDVDPMKDTGGTLRVRMKYKQYDRVSVASSWSCNINVFGHLAQCSESGWFGDRKGIQPIKTQAAYLPKGCHLADHFFFWNWWRKSTKEELINRAS